MSTGPLRPEKLRVVIAGGGVAALEAALALADLARDRTDLSVIAPNSEFVYRPTAVREPFAYGRAHRYALEPMLGDAGARLVADELARVDATAQTVHTGGGLALEYDALLLALGAKTIRRYTHALTIDDRRMDETLHGLIQDVEGGYIRSLAFVSPGRIAWPLPLYELALMSAGRAYDMGVEVAITIVTPEVAPLAIFGEAASAAVGERLQRAHITMISSGHCQVPSARELVLNPGERHLVVDRVIALPELYGPSLRGIPLGEHGFIAVDPHGRVGGVQNVFAAGDAVEFALKHGGIAAQQADAAAQTIASLAGAPVTPEPFEPVIRGVLLTDDEPLYLSARISGERALSSEVADSPTWSPPDKIAARYLAPYLAGRAGGSR